MRNFGIFLFFLFSYSLSLAVFAQDLNFEISVENNQVALGESLQLNLTFSGGQNIPAFDLPALEGFQARYVGPSTRMSIINGQVSSSVTHIYTLFPLKAGTFKIGPWRFEDKADTYISNTITIEVTPGQPPRSNPQEPQGQNAATDISNRIFLVVQPGKKNVYLNEIVPLSIKLYVHRLGIRDIQYPILTNEGFSVTEFTRPRQYQENLGGVTYEVLEFETSFFGLKTGELKLGPAEMNCNLISKKQGRRGGSSDFDDFFNSDILEDFFGSYQTQPLNLKSAHISVSVLSLPEENRPQNFKGAIGNFDFEASLSPLEVATGDPITVKGIIKGDGNFNTVVIPKIDAAEANFKVYEPQIKQEKYSKSFEQVLLPLDDKISEIPQLTFSFFNPDSGKYQSITKGPFPIKVSKPKKEEELKIVEPPSAGYIPVVREERLGRDIIFIKPLLGKIEKRGEYLHRNKLFQGLQILPPACFIIFFLLRARKKKLATDIKYARALLAPRKARAGIKKAKDALSRAQKKEFYDLLFQTLQEYLGDRFHLPSKSITVSIIDDILKTKNIPDEHLGKLKDIFQECDLARYAISQPGDEAMRQSLRKLEEVIDHFQR